MPALDGSKLAGTFILNATIWSPGKYCSGVAELGLISNPDFHVTSTIRQLLGTVDTGIDGLTVRVNIAGLLEPAALIPLTE